MTAVIVIFGLRHYGRVDRFANEYQTTKFAHFYWLPLVPIESMWVTRTVGDHLVGFEVKTSARSVAAAYLRTWGPILAVLAVATVSVPGFAIAALLLGLCGWSWTWRDLRRPLEIRRARFHQIAFGTVCDPMRRHQRECVGLRRDIDERFAEHSRGRTPEDVARFGADAPHQAVLAYAVLRLAAASARGRTAFNALVASERILAGVSDGDVGALAIGGPYRGAASTIGGSTDHAAAAEHAAAELDQGAADRTQSARVKTRRSWRDRFVIAGAVVAAVGLGAYIVHRFIEEGEEADAAMVELRRFSDDICACTTRECIGAIVEARRSAIYRAHRAAEKDSSKRHELESIASQVETCKRDIGRAKARTTPAPMAEPE